jgi:hypothetical protein
MTTTESSAPAQRTTRERGTSCSGCSTSTKTLTAPHPNVRHGCEGPMYCLSCNPRFFALDAVWACSSRLRPTSCYSSCTPDS